MGDNLQIIPLEKNIVDVLNASTLPILVKKMILEKVLATATEKTNEILKLEAQEGEQDGIQ